MQHSWPPDVGLGGLPGGGAAVRLHAVRRRRLVSRRPPRLLDACTVEEASQSLYELRAQGRRRDKDSMYAALLALLLPDKLEPTQQPEAGGSTEVGLWQARAAMFAVMQGY